jgi:hypothetical protein
MATVVVLLLGAIGVAAAFELPERDVLTPTITSHSAGTTSTSARFSFTDSDAGVGFVCSLDRSRFTACNSPRAYRRLRRGRHTFRVKTEDKSGDTSRAASYTWTIELTPPAIVIRFPRPGNSYNLVRWSSGCSRGPGLCGSASDPTGVTSLAVSIRNPSGQYWSGGAFVPSSREIFNIATRSPRCRRAPSHSPAHKRCAPPRTVQWTYRLPFAGTSGAYTIHVRATDDLGNSTPARSPTTSTFRIGVAPPTPAITGYPPNPSTSATAAFSFTDSEAGLTFQCKLDNIRWQACTSPISYTGLSVGGHEFDVRAVDAAGYVSGQAGYRWTIVHVGGGGGGKPFTISGSAGGLLAPGGGAQPIAITLSNPNDVPIYVTNLTVSVRSESLPNGCSASGFQITQSNISNKLGITVPPSGSVALPAHGATTPIIQLLDTGTNQDACQGAALTLDYAGSAS